MTPTETKQAIAERYFNEWLHSESESPDTFVDTKDQIGLLACFKQALTEYAATLEDELKELRQFKKEHTSEPIFPKGSVQLLCEICGCSWGKCKHSLAIDAVKENKQ
jgi:hypothetical protein